ncbi:MAG: hypothetical protein HKN72_08280 [Gemmatimonadetes bacterium]|nr:hypothetical protein [Gemmatimonadota bacterium]
MIVWLSNAGAEAEHVVGGKARMLGRLLDAGHRVPAGFCITVEGYERFVASAGLRDTIRMELGRKDFSDMRWEEIWDAALRIRSAFLSAPMPSGVAGRILESCRTLAAGSVVVRSSAPGEDSATASHAGLHESRAGIRDEDSLLDACRVVWASLWSDAALLYRHELGLDVSNSGMAVVIQGFVDAEVSGVGFGVDPRRPQEDRELVEAVPGPCEDLVSGRLDPDRWVMSRATGRVLEWSGGDRGESGARPLLTDAHLDTLHHTLRDVEVLLEGPPDIEWTGLDQAFTLLQARPVTTRAKSEDEREWYLSLRPNAARLKDLCERVENDLIPALEAQARAFATEAVSSMGDEELAKAISERGEALEEWRTTYKDEFIPFAHGVRHLGIYYNDALQPDDPYEFVRLLEHQPMIATERNQALSRLAATIAQNPSLKQELTELASSERLESRAAWADASKPLRTSAAGEEFCASFEELLDSQLNIAFDGESLDERADLALELLLQLVPSTEAAETPTRLNDFEERLLEAVGPERREEALDVLRIGRVSWRLRDDDNILMARLENELRRALAEAAHRLAAAGRLDHVGRIPESAATPLLEALSGGGGGRVSLPAWEDRIDTAQPMSPGESPRQIVGQPAAPGLATGTARVVRGVADLARFRRGDIMVCDAIQPTMTQLVPLAAAVVERRGGMLIHGAIIARELGVPCVNGVPNAVSVLKDGDVLTVDGFLGIVTVGPAEFELELPKGRPVQ